MTISVLETDTAMREVLTAPPADRPGLLTTMMRPLAGMYLGGPAEPDLVAMHHGGSGFRVDRDDDRLLPALDRMVAAECLWPSAENLARLEATATHELAHNLRYTDVVWNPATVTVGEQVVSEGLVDAYLAATGRTAAQALLVDRDEVVASATGRA